MAAPVYVSAGAFYSGTGTTADIEAPASVAADDIILIPMCIGTAASTPTCSGFTQANDIAVVDGAQAFDLRVFWHRPTGSEAGPYTFSFSEDQFIEAVALRFTGCVTSGDPFDVTNSAIKNTTTDGNTPAVSDTTTDVDRLWVWAAGAWNAPPSCSTVSGFTEIIDHAGTFFSYAVDTKTQSTAGSSGSLTAAFSDTSSTAAWLGALKPASGGGGGLATKFWSGSAWGDAADMQIWDGAAFDVVPTP